MTRTLTITLTTMLLASVMLTGCGERLPDGMPRLYPASIIVMQEGEPLAGATVQLISEDSANTAWGPAGMTDASGVAVLNTNGPYRGAPLGTYKVIVTKSEREPHPHPELAESGPRTPDFARFLHIMSNLKAYDFVEPQYGSIAETPLRVEITARGKTYTIDAGKQIKTEIRMRL